MSDVLIDVIRKQATPTPDGSLVWMDKYYTVRESGKFGWKFIGRCVRGLTATATTFSSVVVDNIDSSDEVSP